MAENCGTSSLWVSSEPFSETDYENIDQLIEANGGKQFAVLECFQEIPCNPCEIACPQAAISVGEPLTNLPVLQLDKCTGCGRCISKCPGQAIVVVDTTAVECDRISIPYEYLPLLDKGQIVTAVNRRGQPVCTAKVIATVNLPAYSKTAVVRLEVPKGMCNIVRGIKFATNIGNEG